MGPLVLQQYPRINKGFWIFTAFTHMADPHTFFFSVIHSEVVRQVVPVRSFVLANGALKTSLNLTICNKVLAHVVLES